jgi:hypothetical protein
MGAFPHKICQTEAVTPEILLSFAQLFSKSPMKIENTLRNPNELKGSGGK